MSVQQFRRDNFANHFIKDQLKHHFFKDWQAHVLSVMDNYDEITCVFLALSRWMRGPTWCSTEVPILSRFRASVFPLF